MAALIKDGIVRKLVIENGGEFITPEWCYQEIEEHKEVWNRNNYPDEKLNSIIKDFKEKYVFPMNKELYLKKLKEASKIIGDQDDAPIVALALEIENKGVWTFNTKDFNKDEVKAKISILDKKTVKNMLNYEKPDEKKSQTQSEDEDEEQPCGQ